MFDPFNDIATRGYLRYHFQLNDSRIVKQIEREVFSRNGPAAQQHLADRAEIVYSYFLTVHRILFSEFLSLGGAGSRCHNS